MPSNGKSIYLDHAATTPVLPEVVSAMSNVMCIDFGNPSSRHGAGLAAEEHLDRARGVIARHLDVSPDQIVFTSGGTEANALALLGTARLQRKGGHMLISAIEHPSVLRTARLLAGQGFSLEELPVTGGGVVDPSTVKDRLRRETFLVAVMHVNNETGIRQPVEEIGHLIKEHDPRCRFLVDAVQSLGVLPTRLDVLGADLLSVSGHKIHGPKGVGCLVLGREVRLAPLWGGGDQERGLRPGTENVPGIVGLAKALELCRPEVASVASYTTHLLTEIQRRAPHAYALGDPARRVPHILGLAVPGLPSEVLVHWLEERGVLVSSGAACHSRKSLRSHVLTAMGVPPDHGVVRLSFGHTTTEADVRRAATLIAQGLAALASVHPSLVSRR
jgi:cysteine desulfurase